MQNSVIRVRGSAGLKFPAEFSEKGSDRIDTDSSTTARVEADETLNNDGAKLGAAEALPHKSAAIPAHKTDAKHLRKAKARILIGRSLFKPSDSKVRLDQFENLVEGPPGNTLCSTDYSTPNRRMVNNFLDEAHGNLAEPF